MKYILYTTLLGKKLYLAGLTKKQKVCLKKVFNLYRKNEHAAKVFNEFATSLNAPRTIGPSPVFNQVIWDLWDRLAIRQGFLKKGENSNTDFTENEKALKEFLRHGSG